MSREEHIAQACDELKNIFRTRDEAVEISEGEDRLGEISAEGTEEYPLLVGAIAAHYINSDRRPDHIDFEGDYSEDRWERMVHRALMQVIQRSQNQEPDESEPEVEAADLDSLISDLAEAADNPDQQDGPDQEFVDTGDRTVVDIFEESLEKITKSSNETEYDVYFPLNIRDSEEESFLIDGTEIAREDDSTLEQIFESNDLSEIPTEEKTLEEFLEDNPNLRPPDYNENWYWSCSVEAPSARGAISSIKDVLEIMIGKINYTIYRESDLSSETTLDQLLSPRILDEELIVEPPPFILVCREDDIIHNTSMSDYFGNPVDLDENFQTIYSNLGLRKFPPSYGRISETILASGLRGFFSAVSATNPRESFFAYWRGLEDISFTDPSEAESIDVLKRTGKFCSEDFDILYYRLKQTRNSLVHSGGSPSITARDTIVLREMFLDAFTEIRDIEDSTMDNDTEMKYILEYVDSDVGNIRENLEEKIKELCSDIEEHGRKQTALSAIEDLEL